MSSKISIFAKNRKLLSMNEVVARIDVSRPAGRRIVRGLERKHVVRIEYPLPVEATSEKWHDWDEVREDSINRLSSHYGVDMKALIDKL